MKRNGLFKNIQLGLVPVPHLLHRDLWCSLAARNFLFRMFTGSRLRRDTGEAVRRWHCGQEKQKLIQSRSLAWWTSCVLRLPWRQDRGVVGWKTKDGFQHIRLDMLCFSLHACLSKKVWLLSCCCTLYLNWIISVLFKMGYFEFIMSLLM